jgi:transposase
VILVGDHGGVAGRGELTDRAWARIEPLLPTAGGGRRWRDHRQVINAILWKLRIGAPWRDLPERYGPWKTAHERLRRWSADGTWDRILAEAITKDDSVGTVRSWRLHRRSSHSERDLARWLNPIASGWMNYYGRFYRSELYPLLRRINAYLVRWKRKKFERLKTFKKSRAAWKRTTSQHRRFFAR